TSPSSLNTKQQKKLSKKSMHLRNNNKLQLLYSTGFHVPFLSDSLSTITILLLNQLFLRNHSLSSQNPSITTLLLLQLYLLLKDQQITPLPSTLWSKLPFSRIGLTKFRISFVIMIMENLLSLYFFYARIL